MGIGLGDLSEEELSDVIELGLFGLFGLVGSENGFTPMSVTVEGGVSLGISYLRYLGWVRRRVLLESSLFLLGSQAFFSGGELI